ncbi:MAG: hypothetical protein PHC98_00175 [Syntrophotalea acetylenica]|nr:hypothetical protein [Syntrophotalea acetylenica]
MDFFYYHVCDFLYTITGIYQKYAQTKSNESCLTLVLPDQVLNLEHYGTDAMALVDKTATGDSRERVQDIDSDSVIPLLAATAARSYAFWACARAMVNKVATPIINTLNTKELASLCPVDDDEYQDSVMFMAYMSASAAAYATLDIIMPAVLLTLEIDTDSHRTQATILSKYLDGYAIDGYNTLEDSFMVTCKADAIDRVQNSTKKSDEWRLKASLALENVDFLESNTITPANEKVLDECNELLFGIDVSPREMAFAIAWLTAIHQYTEYWEGIETRFLIRKNT